MDLDELFRFELNNKLTRYYIVEYRQKNNPDITELALPSEFKGLPVIRIKYHAFASSRYLISVKLPSSIRNIDEDAFMNCTSLENVEFPETKVYLEGDTFYGCMKLPAEIQLMSVLCSTNLTHPLPGLEYYRFAPKYRCGLNLENEPLMRADIFELAVKNKCFRTAECEWLLWVLESFIENNMITHLRIAAQGGLLDDGELLGKLAVFSANNGNTELTAWLLDLKNKKIGFDINETYEL